MTAHDLLERRDPATLARFVPAFTAAVTDETVEGCDAEIVAVMQDSLDRLAEHPAPTRRPPAAEADGREPFTELTGQRPPRHPQRARPFSSSMALASRRGGRRGTARCR